MASYKKILLLGFISITFLWYFLLFDPSAEGVELKLNITRILGLMSIQLIWWQVVLGFRRTARLFTPDLLFLNNSIHKNLGRYGFLLLIAHYSFALLSYGIDLVLLSFEFDNTLVRGLKLGQLAFYIALTVWVASALLRKRISWDWWKRIHIAAYFVLPIAFLHSDALGTTLQTNQLVHNWWYFMLISYVLIVLWRLAQWAGLLKHGYKVVAIEDIANGVKRFRLQPQSSVLRPRRGQFGYLQFKRFDQSHPFTISHFDEQTGEISFSIKASGDWTKKLHDHVKVGDTVWVDGPYGVFTQELFDDNSKPVVMVAGGIGITPFEQWVEKGTPKALFYGNQTVNDIAYKNEVDRSSVEVQHILSGQAAPGMIKGYVTVDLIKEKLGQTLSKFEFYICGPPVMMDKINTDLVASGVPRTQIHTERFSL